MSKEDELFTQLMMGLVNLYESGQTAFTIDYEKKDGTSGKLRIDISEAQS